MNGSLPAAVNQDVATSVVDDQFIRAVWDEHAASLLTFALHLNGGDRGWAEDVVQETLLRAWQHPQALDPARGPLRPWLLTVARRITIDQVRARRSRPREVADSSVVALGAVDDEIERVVESWVVADGLSSLTPAHREVLLETYYAGRSVAEAAAVLGVPEGTVKSRTFYALRALKIALEERGVTT